MKRASRILNNNTLFACMSVWLASLVAGHFWPASWWLEVASVNAGPATARAPIPMSVERKINRTFFARWTVTVRQWRPDGWEIVCTGSGATPYRKDAQLPARLTLNWWSGGACNDLPAGRYTVGTTWTIKPDLSILPDKFLSVESGIFEVTP